MLKLNIKLQKHEVCGLSAAYLIIYYSTTIFLVAVVLPQAALTMTAP